MRPSRTSPLTGRTLSQRSASSGDTIGSGTQVNVSTAGGAVALNAPSALYPSPELAAFIVYDSSGQAGTNPITIAGNGRTIDGATSYVHNIAGGALLFLFNQDENDWNVSILTRRDPVSDTAFYLAKDIRAAMGGLSTTTARVLSVVSSMKDWGVVNLGGNVSMGCQYWALRAGIVVSGLRFVWAGRACNIKVSLWDENGGAPALVTSATGPVAAGPVIGQVLFPAAVTLAIQTATPGVRVYTCAFYDAAGSEYTKQSGTQANFATFFVNASMINFARELGNGLVMQNCCLWATGDVRPFNTAATEVYACEPILSSAP